MFQILMNLAIEHYTAIVITILAVVVISGAVWQHIELKSVSKSLHNHIQRVNYTQEQILLNGNSTYRKYADDFNKRLSLIESATSRIDDKLEVIFVNTKVEKSKQLTQEELQQAVKELSGLIESARTNLAKNVFSVHEAVTQLDKSVASTFIKSLTGTGKS